MGLRLVFWDSNWEYLVLFKCTQIKGVSPKQNHRAPKIYWPLDLVQYIFGVNKKNIHWKLWSLEHAQENWTQSPSGITEHKKLISARHWSKQFKSLYLLDVWSTCINTFSVMWGVLSENAPYTIWYNHRVKLFKAL